MKLARFRLYSAPKKLAQVLAHGRYLTQLASRRGLVSLYYLPGEGKGFFVEVGYDAHRCQAVFRRGFRRPRRLYRYVAQLSLPAVVGSQG